MGALHDGHLALVEAALQKTDQVIASIFVNPAQFAPGEDLDTYPRTLEEDLQKLKVAGCAAVWVPSVDDIYPDGDMKSNIKPAAVAQPLEGERRPHFFQGVVTVVYKLFNHTKPAYAFFGEKDYQQLLVIKHMVQDYNMPIEIIGVPTMRDKNGLALSSRNQYLNDDEYKTAIQLNKILHQMMDKGEDWAVNELINAGFDKVDYCTIRHAITLLPSETGPHRALAAAWIGKTRLIDNIAVPS